MFSKGQTFLIGATALVVGFGIGYSKAREMFLEALIRAIPDQSKEKGDNENG